LLGCATEVIVTGGVDESCDDVGGNDGHVGQHSHRQELDIAGLDEPKAHTFIQTSHTYIHNCSCVCVNLMQSYRTWDASIRNNHCYVIERLKSKMSIECNMK